MVEQVSLAKTAAIGALEHAINRALQLDPGTLQALRALHGHIFAVECTEPAIQLFLHINDPLRLSEHHEGDVTTRVVGSASDFAGLVTADDPAAALINSGISVHGKTGPLIELQHILKNVDIDWEEPIADIFGDPLGHQIGRGIRRAMAFAKTLPPKLQARIEAHLYDEARLTPRRQEFEAWVKGVADLNMGIERLQAKVNLLRRKREQGAKK